MAPFALRARWVLPVASPPIAGGVVTVADERIVGIGSRAEVGAEMRDLGDVVLMPGLVNAHTHLEFSNLAEPLGQPGISLPEWIRLVIANRKQQGGTSGKLVAGLEESVQAGVTTIGDIATSPFRVDHADVLPEVTSFHEVIGFSEARVGSVFVELEQRLQTANTSGGCGISPHAPYTVHPQLLERLVDLASDTQLPVAMHLAESREELQLLRDNSGPFRELLDERSMWDSSVFAAGLRPLDYLRVLSRAPRSLVVHGNYLDREELEFVAQRPKMTIVFCPRTHAFFGHSDYPLKEMLDQGVGVAIGTDSRASNPDLSLLNELRSLAHNFRELDPDIILKLGTLNGAIALGLDSQVGSLEVGKLANLTAIACEISGSEPLAEILFGNQKPLRTWIRGREVTTAG